MNTCNNMLCELFNNINWLWYIIATIVTFGIGAVWYSFLFSKAWIRVFKVEMPTKIKTSSMVKTMLFQIIASALYGIAFFIIVKISVGLAFLSLIGFCAWSKAGLNFQFAKMSDFIQASIIQVGYTFIAGLIFILFGLI